MGEFYSTDYKDNQADMVNYTVQSDDDQSNTVLVVYQD
jgi:hypothetical protein